MLETLKNAVIELTAWFQKLVDACKAFAKGFEKDFPNMPEVL